MDTQLRYQYAKRVTLVGAVVNAALGIAKILIGKLGQSHALMADGVHSLSDLLTDALVLIASRYGSQDADPEHPYGHGRIETAATLFLSILLSTVGVGIMYDASWHLFYHPYVTVNWFVLGTAVMSIVAKEILFQYTRQVGLKVKSDLLVANAWHHRSDAMSSVVVLIAIVGVYFGFYYCDALAAVVVGAMIVKMGWSLGWSSIQELVDKGVSPELLEEIKTEISKTPGIIEVHQLRTRSMSGKVLVDVHILVREDLSVSEGHHIAECVHFSLRKHIKEVFDVTIHVDPEDDEVASPSYYLPSREEVIRAFKERWVNLPWIDQVGDICLHYLSGKINADIMLPLSLISVTTAEELQTQIEEPLSDLMWLRKCRLLFVMQ